MNGPLTELSLVSNIRDTLIVSGMDVNLFKRICMRMYKSMCYLLFLLLIIYISMIYFRYETDTNVAPYTPIKQELPRVSLCFDLSTLIFGNLTRQFFDTEYPAYVPYAIGTQFHRSPRVTQLLTKCSYRLFSNDTYWTNINSSECSELFNVKRYRMQGYMCYKLQFVESCNYSFYLNTHSIFDQRRLFTFYLKDPFNKGHAILPILHFNELPYDERIFDHKIVPSLAHAESYVISYNLYEINKLPPPYSTHCVDGLSKNECLDLCYAKLQFISHFTILTEDNSDKNLKISFVSDSDPILLNFSRTRKTCRKKCPFDTCRKKLAITYVSPPSRARETSFTVETAHFPVNKVSYVEKYKFADYLLQSFSWADICIGFSILNSIFAKFNLINRSRANKLRRRALRMSLEINVLTAWIKNKEPFRNGTSNRNNRSKSNLQGKRRFKFIPALTVTMVPFIFLTWQLTNVTSNYFRFETTWKFTFHLNHQVELPNTVICTTLDDFYGIQSRNPYDLNVSNYHETTIDNDRRLNYTIEQMFDFTWNEVLGQLGKQMLQQVSSRTLQVQLHCDDHKLRDGSK